MKNLACAVLACLFLSFTTFAQKTTEQDTSKVRNVRTYEYVVPSDEKPLVVATGIGLGAPYGTFGARVSLGNALISGDLGLGIMPFAWDMCLSAGATIHFLDRYAGFNPHLTLQYTTAAAYGILLKGTTADITSTSVYYKEGFPGYAILAGLDIRLGRTSHFFVTLSFGAVVPSVGMDEVERRYNAKKAEMSRAGYSVNDLTMSFGTFPKFALGISYVLGRSLERQ